MKMFQRILMATDFSPASTPALEQSVKLAKRDGALLLIAHAYQEPGLVELSHAPARFFEQWNQALREAVERKLRPLVDYARKEGVRPKPCSSRASRTRRSSKRPDNRAPT